MSIEIEKKSIQIYNSLTGRKELFQPIHKGYVGIYVCGPTVYHHLHLGNCRTFILFDFVFRYFKHLGYKVRYVRNITDVGHLNNGEDKILNKSRIEGLEPMEIVQKYTISFHYLLNIFNAIPPSIEPTATGHIIDQIDIIQELIKKDLAYEKNGSVYFDIKNYRKNHSYGIMSQNKIDKLLVQKQNFLGDKRSFQDFSLWKKAKKNHIMNWNSPWGKGFPGWHIECTTMSTKYLGEIFDIHGGGLDLKFPHHECELAQAIGAYNNNPAHYWMHTNMLIFNGKKMSKSTGNYFLLKDLISPYGCKKTFHPTIIRFFILKSHYRSILNFSNKGIMDAEKGYYRLMNAMKLLNHFSIEKKTIKNNSLNVIQWIKNCYKAINDDFNTPLLISHLFKVTHLLNSSFIHEMDTKDINLLKKYMNYFVFDILGLQIVERNILENDSKKLKILIERLIKIRTEERKKKNWILSDKIREELSNIGISLHDEKIIL
ncbi:MAG: cysteine--tRNA ligase [Flavobacteriales bacterium]|jgi:cysteinyl-tRNA synthetase|uniref:cysteine--tRNA ligase n=1 Tax=Blattabacterium sp. (Mastotermes darwiniensis) TaxID=39768 RepID=UPI000231DE1D|nr:cysteine--tRNA ligase [Blattabacterium sp. (Mastotermes darwiniensis)]AER40593.1 cysteinyl-tRNA synthetase [Blattabacterium sp. (Mastotermes darwiniensis) str. MADAR]MDR1805090.1 cysteine--tRNA ligase [Flavobacteriales bacterium]